MTARTHAHIFSHFRRVDPRIAHILVGTNLNKWTLDHKTQNRLIYFHRLIKSIISQQLSTKAAATIYARFESLFDPVITPSKLIDMPEQTIRDAGLSWAKIRYAKEVARAIESDDIDWDQLHMLPDKGVIASLTTIKGIGQWTAEMFLMFTLGREDIFSYGDAGLRQGIAHVYSIENPSKDQIEAIITPWSPYKTYGSIALWESLK